MSASVEVNITVKGVSHEKKDAVVSAVHLALLGTGLPDTKSDKNALFGSDYTFADTSEWEDYPTYSFDVYTKSLSVAWDVLSDEFVSKIIQAVHKADPEAEASVYVYNLDREPDYEGHTVAYKTIQLL